MVGAAVGTSRLWFTKARGVATEVYRSRPNIPRLKDTGHIVADGAGFRVELRGLNDYAVQW
jgi:glucoamylase